MPKHADIERDIRDIRTTAERRLGRGEALSRRQRFVLADYEQGVQDGFRDARQVKLTGRDDGTDQRGRTSRSGHSLSYQEGYLESAARVRDSPEGLALHAPRRLLPEGAGRRGPLTRLWRFLD